MTAQLGINNADASVCVEKVFDSKNSTQSWQHADTNMCLERIFDSKP
jgi:hypothetical protein